MDADRRTVGVDTLISFPLCPVSTDDPHAVAYERTTERGGGGGVWGSSHRIKVERDLREESFCTVELWELCEKKRDGKGKCRVESIDIEGRCKCAPFASENHPHMLLKRHVNSMFCGSVVLLAREQKKQRA